MKKKERLKTKKQIAEKHGLGGALILALNVRHTRNIPNSAGKRFGFVVKKKLTNNSIIVST
jgi:hypothetical protein